MWVRHSPGGPSGGRKDGEWIRPGQGPGRGQASRRWGAPQAATLQGHSQAVHQAGPPLCSRCSGKAGGWEGGVNAWAWRAGRPREVSPSRGRLWGLVVQTIKADGNLLLTTQLPATQQQPGHRNAAPCLPIRRPVPGSGESTAPLPASLAGAPAHALRAGPLLCTGPSGAWLEAAAGPWPGGLPLCPGSGHGHGHGHGHGVKRRP